MLLRLIIINCRFIDQQVCRAGPVSLPKETNYTELMREGEEKIQFCMDSIEKPKQLPPTLPPLKNPLQSTGKAPSVKISREREQTETGKKSRKSALEQIQSLEEKRRESQNRCQHWLHKGIVVKVQTDRLGSEYYEKKGVVVGVEDKFVALVKMTDTGDIIEIDQLYLETVIPNIGRDVLVVNGANRGHRGRILRVSRETFSVEIEMLDGPLTGTKVKGVEFEDVCKLSKEL